MSKQKSQRYFIVTFLLVLVSIIVIAAIPAAAVEVGIQHQHIKQDEGYNLEDKGLSGVSLGFKEGSNTFRFSYGGGDIWTSGTNLNLKSLRLDLERDLLQTFLRPYVVFGAGHLNLNNGINSTGSTYGTAGAGLKLNLSRNIMTSLDIRTMVNDRGGWDSANANFQFTYTLGSRKPAKALPPVITLEPTEPSHLVLFFDTNSATLSSLQKEQIAKTIKGGTGVITVGFASSIGSDDYNYKLSINRALAVKDYIDSLGLGIDVYTSGAGERLAHTFKDHADAQRVEISVY